MPFMGIFTADVEDTVYNCQYHGQLLPSCFKLDRAAEICSFAFFLTAHADDTVDNCAIASDGCHLYILNKKGLLKLGSGYGGTISVSMNVFNPTPTPSVGWDDSLLMS